MIYCQGCGASDPKLNARPCSFLHCALGADVPVTERIPPLRLGGEPSSLDGRLRARLSPAPWAAAAADTAAAAVAVFLRVSTGRVPARMSTRMFCSEICCATDASVDLLHWEQDVHKEVK